MIGVIISYVVVLLGISDARPYYLASTNKATNVSMDIPSSLSDQETSDVHWIYYPPGTHDHRAKDFYVEYDLKFIGYGENLHGSGHIQGIGSFESCIKWCYDKRVSHGCGGNVCNGVVYYWSGNLCNCWSGDDKGHKSDNELLHYRFG